MSKIFSALLAVVAAAPVLALANTPLFPDVPADHMYRAEIEELVSGQIIKGNDDGTFAPERALNRAEMLALLYRATGRTPDPSASGCFPDAQGWFEPYVCDAVANKFVQGYPDGMFKPGASVTRVEALKMIINLFGITTQAYGVEQRDIIKFVDVSTSAWYSGYLYTAFKTGILPITGQDGARLYPDWPLLRGEAAAYISNALHVEFKQAREENSSSSEEVAASSTASTASTASAASVKSAASSARPTSLTVLFPFTANGKFVAKTSYSYTFTVETDAIALTTVKLTGGAGSVSCRLYLIAESGFSSEYYLGYQEGSTCTLLTSLKPGNYQLQLQPTVADAAFTVDMNTSTGDGNDGFKDAKRLLPGIPKIITLSGTNYADYYSFSTPKSATMKIELTTTTNMKCIVYALEDVDLASFTGPECNQTYLYPKGNYIVAVTRSATKGAKQTYTITLR
ncbi:MAG: S-layer homology domain-containing protein [Patescibacteria group bacterium]